MRLVVIGLLAWFVVASLAGCGWRLRGAVEVPPALQQSCITGVAAFSELGVELRSTLKRAGATVLDKCDNADAQLQITRDQMRKRVLSVDSAGRAAEFELNYEVSFTVIDKQGAVLVASQSVELNRDYRFDPDNVLAKGEEEKRLRAEMVSFAVRQIMQRIEAITKSAAGKKA